VSALTADSRRRLDRVLLVAVALQAVLLGAQLLLELRLLDTEMARDGGLAAVVAAVLGVAAFPAVGLVIVRRRPEHPVGWLFCVATLGFTMANTAGAYVRLAFVTDGALPAMELVAWGYAWSGRLSIACFVLLLLLFPTGRFLTRRWRRVGQGSVTVIVITALAAAFAPGPVDRMIGVAIENPAGISGPAGSALWLAAEAGWPMGFGLMLTAVGCLVLRYRRSGGMERQQLKWFVAGVAFWALWLPAFFAGALLHTAAGAWPLWARVAGFGAILGGAAIPITAAVAILRYRLYDIDRIVSRTVGYVLVSGVLAAVYLAVVLLASRLIAPFGADNDLAVAAATLAAAALFRPVRRTVQVRVDRRFNRARYDAEHVLAAFRERLRDEVELADVAEETRSALVRTVEPVRASLWLHVTGAVTVPGRSRGTDVGGTPLGTQEGRRHERDE
jgi:hypothetical protein